ncbi:MAG: N-acetylneuraminate synthase family protein [Deltaproteobacteria bacterium]|jgi:sialic acid synthase SpsE|nr:N-acetylneuraminate synthase family protein [Deltaproteobacteria bacterium]
MVSMREMNRPEKGRIILEIGGNHQGDPALARSMVEAAAETGAWAVKFQAYRVSELVHPDNPAYSELLKEETDFGLLADLIKLSHDLSLRCGVSVFSREAVELACDFKADFIKISSGDIDFHPLIRTAALSGIPLILSTGASAQSEVDEALALLKAPPLALLQCTSLYPCPPEDVHLAVMAAWLERGLPAGLSDHSLGTEAALMALGESALAVEKHFTTDRTLKGGDNFMSILPSEAARLSGREKIPQGDPRSGPYWGSPVKAPLPSERPDLIRRFAVAGADIKKGKNLSLNDLVFLRVGPGPGRRGLLSPGEDFAKYSAGKDLSRGEVILKKNLRFPR